jgi:hypothetical protein
MQFRSPLAFLVALLAVAPASAQFGLGVPENKVRITDVKIGFPATRFTNERDDLGSSVPILKAGTWAPVQFRLEVLRPTDLKLHVELESSDGDKHITRVRWPLGNLVRNKQATGPDDQFLAKGSFIEPSEFEYMPVVKIGGPSSGVRLRILMEETNGEMKSASDTVVNDNLQTRNASTYTILSLGTKLPSFNLTSTGRENPNSRGLRGGRVETAAFASVETMPDHWYAYETADLVILATGNCSDDFLKKLFDDVESVRFKHKREALLEWIRRGGKFVLSLTRKAEILTTQSAFRQFLPVSVPSIERIDSAYINIGSGMDFINKPRKKLDAEGKPLLDQDGNEILESEPVRYAKLQPLAGKSMITLAKIGRGDDIPAIVQTAVGLGRFTVVGFDLDTSPFLDQSAEKKTQFWDVFVKQAGSDKAADQSKNQDNNSYNTSFIETEEGAFAALRNHVEHFEGVPVISFGWVALFIILYTLLIGPLEYIFLKKVLGRLELTWITFPIIVISVSVAAYYTAYSLKGKDLKINKVDVVDIDVGGGRVYGRTWYTIFSPRPASYTLSVEPKESWAVGPTDAADPVPESIVDWMGGAKIEEEGGIASRNYRYRLDPNGGTRQASETPNGIDNLTIAVWATKSLTASWSGYASKTVVESTIAHGRKDTERFVAGQLAINLPLTGVEEAVAYYKGDPYSLNKKKLSSGLPVVFDSAVKGSPPDWLNKQFILDTRFYTVSNASEYPTGQTYGNDTKNAAPVTTTPIGLWGILFHEFMLKNGGGGRGLQNAGLRMLDESWRLEKSNTEEVIVLLKLAPNSGPSEEQFTDPASSSPTKLWVKGMPGKEPRPAVPGVLQQETYIRIYIPVLPGKK